MTWPNNVSPADLKIEYMRGSGPGGQNRNKRDTACRITHIPTGISARAEDQRTQALNKSEAFRRLAKQLIPLMIKKDPPVQVTTRVRTYHAVRKTVKDDRVPGRVFNYNDVLDGDLDPIIEELVK